MKQLTTRNIAAIVAVFVANIKSRKQYGVFAIAALALAFAVAAALFIIHLTQMGKIDWNS